MNCEPTTPAPKPTSVFEKPPTPMIPADSTSCASPAAAPVNSPAAGPNCSAAHTTTTSTRSMPAPFRPKNGDVWSASAAMIASPTVAPFIGASPAAAASGAGSAGGSAQAPAQAACVWRAARVVGGGVDSVGAGVGRAGGRTRRHRARIRGPCGRRARRRRGGAGRGRRRGRAPPGRAGSAPGRRAVAAVAGAPPVGDGPVVCGGSSTTSTAPTSAKSTAGVTAMRL